MARQPLIAAAIIGWLTVAGGLTLVALLTARGGLAARPTISFGRIAGHAAFGAGAVALITLELVVLTGQREVIVTVALLSLLAAAVLGGLMARHWWMVRQRTPAGVAGEGHVRPEARTPPIVVIGHGLAALTTIVLVAVSAVMLLT